MRSRKVGSAFAATFTALALAACGSSDDDGTGTSASTASGGGADDPGTLIASGWGATYDEATLEFFGEPFAAAGGAELKMVPVTGGHAARVEAQQRAGKVEWDMIDSATASDAYRLDKAGHLEHLPPDLKAKLVEELGAEKVTDFGFTIGTVGTVIVCNMDRMDSCPTSMEEFFDGEAYPQTRMVPGLNPIAMATAGMVASGTPADETATTPIDVDEAFAPLEGIEDKVKVYFESGEQSRQAIRSGEVDMALMWSGSAYQVKNGGANLQINWDEGIYEAGYWVVLKDAPNKEQAFDFLEFVATHPEEEAGWAEAVGYGVPNPKAVELMPEEAREAVPENPAHFDKIVQPNYGWYVEGDNAQLLDQRFQDLLRG